jgi:hypothetical protein
MAYITINTPQDITNCIQSIDDTFAFKDKNEMTSKLNEIEFVEYRQNIFDEYPKYFWFDGFINNDPVSIRISKQHAEDTYRLMDKYFFKMIDNKKVPHRDNNLPSYICHDNYDTIGAVNLIHYFLNGQLAQYDSLLAPCIRFQKKKVCHQYNLPKYEDRSANSVTIDNITCENNIVTDIKAFYGYTEISLNTLVTAIPRTENFTFRQLANLKNELTSNENTLLHMLSI